ncbi:MAG: ATP-NAD kinase family protein [Candidatus Hodarchaeota archaeon]
MNDSFKKKLGFIVNPIAGIGGKYGLKGSDNPQEVKELLSSGAELVAPVRGLRALKVLSPIKNRLGIFTYPKEMGEDEVYEAGLKEISHVIGKIKQGCTTSEDTKRAVSNFTDHDVDLIVFVGGDGTARDVLDIVDKNVPILGIPAGVKMYSGVFATNPEVAGYIIMRYFWEELSLICAEVIDIDEAAMKQDQFNLALYGYALTPSISQGLHGSKSPSPLTMDEAEAQKSISKRIIEEMQPDTIYILGPGTTIQAISQDLGLKKTLFGVDMIKNGKMIAEDVDEKQILEKIRGKEAKIILSPIGTQGFLLGRGNQQISPKVLKEVGFENLIVIATPEKLTTFEFLHIDTGDKELDTELGGRWIRIITSYHEERVVKILPSIEATK